MPDDERARDILTETPNLEKVILSSTGDLRSRSGALCGRISLFPSRSRLEIVAVLVSHGSISI